MDVSIINNTASQGFLLGERIAELGHNYTIYGVDDPAHTFTKSFDRSKYVYVGKKLGIPFERSLRRILSRIRSTDLQIVNAGQKYFRAKKTIFWWHGSDIRGGNYSTNRKELQFVSSPDLLKINPRKLILLNRIVEIKEKKMCTCEYTIGKGDSIRIGIFPSKPSKKGISEIDRILKVIKNSFDIEIFTNGYERGEKIPREHLICAMQSCDIVFDQFTPEIGSLGLTGLEAISMGIPVLSTLSHPEDPELYDYVAVLTPDLSNLKKEIEKVLEMDKNKAEKYIQKHHDGRRTIEILEEYSVFNL